MDLAPSQASDRPRPTVFLSYASEDRAAAQRIRDALPGLGLEVWYDESELLGGDAWDQKIRGQIRDCDFFMPVISAHTEARREGYFRREWRLATERTLDMADDSVFLVPVVIDDTREADARVPDKFRAVQWVRVPGGEPNAALESLGRRLVSGEHATPPTRRAAKISASRSRTPPPRRTFPAFPREEPGQRARFWAQVGGWALQSTWTAFQRLPKWVRVIIYIWIALVILQYSMSSHRDLQPTPARLKNLAQAEKILKALPQSAPTAEAAKILAQMGVQKTSASAGTARGARVSLLAIRFSAAAGNSAARTLARDAFDAALVQLARLHHARVTLSPVPLATLDAAAAAQRAQAGHCGYVLYGGLRGQSPQLTLAVRIAAAAHGSVMWSKSYPVPRADPARIAADVRVEVRRLEKE